MRLFNYKRKTQEKIKRLEEEIRTLTLNAKNGIDHETNMRMLVQKMLLDNIPTIEYISTDKKYMITYKDREKVHELKFDKGYDRLKFYIILGKLVFKNKQYQPVYCGYVDEYYTIEENEFGYFPERTDVLNEDLLFQVPVKKLDTPTK